MLYRAIGLLVVLGVCAVLASAAEQVRVVVEVVRDGTINWTQGEVHAIGLGVAPAFAKTAGQKRVFAREAAIVAAERNLLKILQGVSVTSETKVENLALKSDIITTRVQGLLRGAVIVKETAVDADTYKIEMAVNLYGGEKSLAAAIDFPQQFSESLLPEPPAQPAPVPAQGEPYTGLLIDCRGKPLARAMCPRILDPAGNRLYQDVEAPEALLQERGVAGYFAQDTDPTLTARVGKHPLIVKAQGITGRGVTRADVVLSAADFALVQSANAQSHFLEKLAVAILVDAGR